MADRLVNQSAVFSGSASPTAALGATSLTAGNFIVIHVRWGDSTRTITGIADTAGNTYTRVTGASGTSGVQCVDTWIAFNVTGHATNVVTVTFSANTTSVTARSTQYTGIKTSASPVAASSLDIAASGIRFFRRTTTTTAVDQILVAFSFINTGSGSMTWIAWGDGTEVPTIRKIADSTTFSWADINTSNTGSGVGIEAGTGSADGSGALAVILLDVATASDQPIRLTQEAIEVIDAASEGDIRLTQEAIEVVDGGSENIVLTQLAIEVITDPLVSVSDTVFSSSGVATVSFTGEDIVPGPLRVTQVLAEIGEDPGVSDTRITQVVGEAAQAPNEIRVTQVVGEAAQAPNEVRITQIIAEVAQDNTPVATSGDTRVTQLFLTVLGNRGGFTLPDLGPCDGGGLVPVGVNPAAGVDLQNATTPLVWLQFSVAGGPATPVYAAKVAINTDTARKPPRLLTGGHVTRGLSDFQGRMETASAQVVLNDTDRFVRGLVTDGSIFAQDAALYLADKATIDAGGIPRRLLLGKVKDFSFPSDFQVELVIEDQLTFETSPLAGETMVPKHLIANSIVDDTSGEKEDITSWPNPLCYGALNDEETVTPLGVVPSTFVQTSSVFPELGNLNVFLVCLGVVKDIKSIYCADYWNGGETPTTRVRVPEEAYGDWIWAPWRPGWPSTNQWLEVDGKRYTCILARQDNVASILAREGRIPFTVNLCGYEDVGDGTGTMISSLPRQFVHFLINFIFNDYSGAGNWQTAIPMLGGTSYSAVDTTTVDAVKTILDTRVGAEHEGAFILGHSQNQISLDDVIAQFARCMGADIFINKHGQVALTTLDRDSVYAAAKQLDQRRHIARGIRFDARPEEVENTIEYFYERRYHKLLAEDTQDAQLRVREPKDTKWISGVQTVADTAAITAMGGKVRKSRPQEYDMIRLGAIAAVLAQQRLDWLARPRFQVGVPLVDYYGMDMELGDVVKVTHEQGMSATGWTDRRCQIRRLTVDVDNESTSLTVRDVDDLLP